MVITLTGPNDFARKLEATKLVAEFLHTQDAMAVERLDGEEATAQRMQGALSSLPFLTERKLVLLREPSKQKAFAENIQSILQEVADSTDVVIIEPKLDKRLSYYKTLKKQTDFREFGELDADGLARWALTYVKEAGGTLGAADARMLVDMLGINQQMLAKELDKLLSFDPQITQQTIQQLVEPLPQSTVFQLLDAAFQGKTARALALYAEQRALKVEPQAIVAMLAWQLHVLALIKTAGNRSAADIAAQAKLNPFVVRKSMEIARHLSAAHLQHNIAELLAIDIASKTTAIDNDEALRLYLLRLA